MHPHYAVKICGITTDDELRHAAACGATHVGFVHVPSSPRHLSLSHLDELYGLCPAEVTPVIVVQSPSEEQLLTLSAYADRAWLQLHGSRPREAQHDARFWPGKIIIGMSIREPSDLTRAEEFAGFADAVLLDAPALERGREGGHGVAFDWSLLNGWNPDFPWWLAGGLMPENIRRAIEETGAKRVDVSSGVEYAEPRPDGRKDPARVRDFIAAAHASFKDHA